MPLLGRQTANTEILDDQSPTLWGSFVGNWTRGPDDRANNRTTTVTPTPGASLSFTFTGSQARLFGGLSYTVGADGMIFNYPTADYSVDGTSAGTQRPRLDPATGAIIYFQTPELRDISHKIDITVTGANSTNLYIVDCFLVSHLAGVSSSGGISFGVPPPTPTSSPTPASSTPPITAATSNPTGPIVGGVVGGVSGIAILTTVAWYLLRRFGGRRARRLGMTSVEDIFDDEAQSQRSGATVDSTTKGPQPDDRGGPGPQSAYSSGSPNRSSKPPMRQTTRSGPTTGRAPGTGTTRRSGTGTTKRSGTGTTRQSRTGTTRQSGTGSKRQSRTGTTRQPGTGNTAQQDQNVGQLGTDLLEDSGIMTEEDEEQEADPSRLPDEVPPSDKHV